MELTDLLDLYQLVAADFGQYWDYFMTLLKTYAIIIGIAYVLPGIIASVRKNSNQAVVWVITLFLGWTYVGWVVALAMAFSKGSRTQRAQLEQLRKEIRGIRWLLETYLPTEPLTTEQQDVKKRINK